MASTRILNWYESQDDTSAIAQNGWNFQMAMAVVTGRSDYPTYDVVWQSHRLAPATRIAWGEGYALNWTNKVPAQGTQISVQGRWQPYNKGESYDIDSNGFWQRSASPGEGGWLSVGKINYSYPGVPGIHIVIGVRNPETGRFDAIFIDKDSLPSGSSAKYQPQDAVSWWLGGGQQAGQVFNYPQPRSFTYDFSDTNSSNEWSTSFATKGDHWNISPGSPPQS